MDKRISPVRRVAGSVRLPGDKSISHRYAMLAAIADGGSKLYNYSSGADCQSTLGCVRALGVPVSCADGAVQVDGRGLHGLVAPASELDAGNSGSTIRMLTGILAAQPFRSRIGGDQSLSRRPMARIIEPLSRMGASISAREGKYPPLDIAGAPLRAIDYSLPVPSAQVKTSILFAGLFADGETTVREPIRTRDHTELALREFGAEIAVRRGIITVNGNPRLTGRELLIPGDLSSAAFFIVAALLLPGSELLIEGVGLNPTRASLVDFLAMSGARIRIAGITQAAGELIGTLEIRHGGFRGGVIEGALTAALIDEIPVLAVLGAASAEGLTVRDAAELRVKETDRIAALADNFRRMGVSVAVAPDGFHIPGQQNFAGAQVDSFGDHRIAMAFAVAALAAGGETTIRDADAAAVSFPEFFDTLGAVAE
ncbi:MAG TPA: 3-phosphoshikimate 1-carboxyvinyltransferase [Bryobacteraceae bacterium]|nr:3-phosphoshikimate 1-carboxyvinyltransferase [Bryobacteraceae bacterium]